MGWRRSRHATVLRSVREPEPTDAAGGASKPADPDRRFWEDLNDIPAFRFVFGLVHGAIIGVGIGFLLYAVVTWVLSFGAEADGLLAALKVLFNLASRAESREHCLICMMIGGAAFGLGMGIQRTFAGVGKPRGDGRR